MKPEMHGHLQSNAVFRWPATQQWKWCVRCGF